MTTASPTPETLPKEEPSDTPFDQARPLWDHLEEFRRRLIHCLIAVALAACAGYYLSPRLLERLSAVVGSPLVFMSPAAAFMARLKIAFFAGAILAAPVWLAHAWRFVGVALTVGERRATLGALPFSLALFAAGAAFAWYVVTPAGLEFLVGFGTATLRPMISVEAALSFALWLSLGLGLLFQLPVILVALTAWGLVTPQDLRRHRRHAALAVLVISALITPSPDAASQLLLAVPTYLLYEASILASALVARRNP